jgi:hypothetical protein
VHDARPDGHDRSQQACHASGRGRAAARSAGGGGSKQDGSDGSSRWPGKAHEVSPWTDRTDCLFTDGWLAAGPTLTDELRAYRGDYRWIGDDAMKLKLDLHEIYNQGQDIDRALRDIMDEAVRRKAPLVEIIPGKGSGQLKKRVLRFLDQKENKALYHRVEKDSKNFGRLFVHFRW